MQPEAQKLNEAEQKTLQANLGNYTSIMKKFINCDGWPKSATYLEDLYAESKELMPITPLFLCNLPYTDVILLHVLKHIPKEQHKQILAGNKYKMSKTSTLRCLQLIIISLQADIIALPQNSMSSSIPANDTSSSWARPEMWPHTCQRVTSTTSRTMLNLGHGYVCILIALFYHIHIHNKLQSTRLTLICHHTCFLCS